MVTNISKDGYPWVGEGEWGWVEWVVINGLKANSVRLVTRLANWNWAWQYDHLSVNLEVMLVMQKGYKKFWIRVSKTNTNVAAPEALAEQEFGKNSENKT